MFDEIRKACARVARRARQVRISGDLEAYMRTLPLRELRHPVYDTRHHYVGEPEPLAAYILTLSTVNFGSGYFPRLQKRVSMSGYFTIASYLKDHFDNYGPLSSEELAQLVPQRVAALFQQSLDDEFRIELIELFTQALNDLGRFLLKHYEGSFTALIEDADGSAEKLIDRLIKMPYFNDVAHYDGAEVPIFKRAQITVSDLALAFRGRGFGHFEDLDQLTIFADNLVPHVLRVDGLLSYDGALAERIKAGERIEAGAPEEVEIRATALYAVELMVNALRRDGQAVTARQFDIALWNRGQKSRYKAAPRHRTLTVFY